MMDEFIAYLEEQVKNRSIYVWGAQGQDAGIISERWIKSRETSGSNAEKAIRFWQTQVTAGFGNVLRAFDCSGLGMYWLRDIKGLYQSDMSANSMMKQTEKIEKAELRCGDWVFRVYTSGDKKGTAYHIGYVVDEALQVIEARGRQYGVVKRTCDASGASYWNAFGRPLIFKNHPQGKATVVQLTQPYMRGKGIQTLQEALNILGYDCGKVDGICGQKTMAGVQAFLDAHAAQRREKV